MVKKGYSWIRIMLLVMLSPIWIPLLILFLLIIPIEEIMIEDEEYRIMCNELR